MYSSRPDFATSMARCSATSLFLHELLPRTLAHSSQANFERYLHDAMGWKASTVDDWNA